MLDGKEQQGNDEEDELVIHLSAQCSVVSNVVQLWSAQRMPTIRNLSRLQLATDHWSLATIGTGEPDFSLSEQVMKMEDTLQML